MSSKIAAFVLAAGIAAFAGRADAIAIGGSTGTEGLGSFTGTLTYSALNDTSALLNISITNTSPVAGGGYITAIALNDPGPLTGATLTAKPSAAWNLLGLADDSISGSPYGSFDFGASISSSWLGGGKPNPGLGVGQTGTFTFALTGTGLGELTESHFITALSANPQGGGAQSLTVRFRGFTGGGSDKVPNTVAPPPPPPPPVIGVPEPASLALFGAGLAALGALRRRRRGD